MRGACGRVNVGDVPSSVGGGGGGRSSSESADALLERAASASVDELLELVRTFAGVDVAFVGEFSLGRRIIRFVSGEGPAATTIVGRSHELGATYCRYIAAGAIPPVTDDTTEVPVLRSLDVTAELDIGSYIGVPIRLSDGALYGTLCGFGHEPCYEWPPGLLELLEAVARLVTAHLEAPEHTFLDVLAVQDRIRAVLDDPASLAVAYQPIVEMADERVVGYEALARFPGPAPQPPETWFFDAHEVGLGAELEVLAARRAIASFEWSMPDTFLSLNLSGSVIGDGRLDDLLDGFDPHRFVVELTETRPDYEVLSAVGREHLRRRGVRLAVDDLGAGFAGLSRLIDIEPDIIKLDRFLTMGVDSDRRRSAVAAAAQHLCESMDIPLIAEGIETEADRDALCALGVALGQGHVLGRPVPLRPR